MIRRGAALGVLVLMTVVARADAADWASALGSLATDGQFRLTGTVDQDVSNDTLRVGGRTFRTFSYGTRVAPTVDGYLVDPRLIVISYGGAWLSRANEGNSGVGNATTTEPYRFSLTLLPYGLHSLTFTGNRSTSDFDFDAGRVSMTTETLGAAWRYRGNAVLPETTVGVSREIVDETLLDGSRGERTRDTVYLQLHKELDRARPTFNYSVEETKVEGTNSIFGPFAEGIRHRARLEDRIRVGDQTFAMPLLEVNVGPDGREANAGVTVTGPLSPSTDASAGVRYNYFEPETTTGNGTSATHSTTAQATITKRFTDELVLSAVGNGVLVKGGTGGDAEGGNALVALRAAPWSHLHTVTDYGAQVTLDDHGTSVSNRGHVNAVSTIVPQHTISWDYFVATTSTSGTSGTPGMPHAFVTQSALLGVVSRIVPLTILSAGGSWELQDGNGHHEHTGATAAADFVPRPPLTAHLGAEYAREVFTGGGRTPNEKTSYIGDAALTLRAQSWLQVGVTGRYGVRDVSREDRTGLMGVSELSANAAVTLGSLFFRVEGFTERDQDARQQRLGVRGGISYRFRAWTLTGDFEESQLTVEGLKISRDHFIVRLSRPLNFTFP
jgi:hypothetical protein